MPRVKSTPPPPPPSPETKSSDVELKFVPIDKIVPNDFNVNTQDTATFSRLQDEIAEIGFIDPLQVVPLEGGTYMILGGEHRWKAAKALGYEKLPCTILTHDKWKDTDLLEFVHLRLNILRGKTDPEKFVAFYTQMAQKHGEDSLQRLMGFTDQKAFQKMVGWVNKGLRKSLPKEMHKKIDQVTQEAASMEELTRVIQDLFQEYGDTLSQSFMVFSFGKQKHLFVEMDQRMRKAMDRVVDCCKVTKVDINEFLAPLVESLLKEATKRAEDHKAAVAAQSSTTDEHNF
jgi:hypothetical protein